MNHENKVLERFHYRGLGGRPAVCRLELIKHLQAQQEMAQVRRWLKPRLGHLRHHPPRALEIPERYLAEPPVDSGPVISVVTPTLMPELSGDDL